MNSKQSKKLKTMAELFYNMQVVKLKTLDQIYQELKVVHNEKIVPQKKGTRTNTKIRE